MEGQSVPGERVGHTVELWGIKAKTDNGFGWGLYFNLTLDLFMGYNTEMKVALSEQKKPTVMVWEPKLMIELGGR